jgi:alkane 1-monooxygenase
MDPRVMAHVDGDLTRVNVSPRKREKYLNLGGDPARDQPSAGYSDPSSEISRRVTGPREVLAARCPGCGYTYEVAAGDEHEGFAAGTAWADVPDSWCCPDCGVRDKVDFVPVEPTSVTP